MIVSYNKAEFIKDEHGKTTLHLELHAHVPGTRVIILYDFPATSNFEPEDILQSPLDTEIILNNRRQE